MRDCFRSRGTPKPDECLAVSVIAGKRRPASEGGARLGGNQGLAYSRPVDDERLTANVDILPCLKAGDSYRAMHE